MQSPPVASLLWRTLRVYQLFGANTDVGKTVFATLLGRTAGKLWKDEAVAYLKPTSIFAHCPSASCLPVDGRLVGSHVRRFAPDVAYQTLFQYDAPLSPHKAAPASGKPVPSDDALLSHCRQYAAECAARPGKGWLLIETAGGVHSPGPSGTTQADLYAPLRPPAVLIGDARLGGISQTIAAFESLRLRGYQVESVLLFRDGEYENHRFLAQHFQRRHRVPVTSLAGPPPRHGDAGRDAEAMAAFYGSEECADAAGLVLERLRRRHDERIASLEALPARALRHIWYPFTQQSLLAPGDIAVIDSAHGDCFQTLAPAPAGDGAHGQPLLRASFDGSASWWTQGLGHGNARLALAAAYAAGRYGHVMFAGAIHEPAMALAEALLEATGNPRLNRVFFSDDGSTGTEVALKMALRATRLRRGRGGAHERLGVLGLRGGYHGDTIGAMDSAAPCVFNEKVDWYQGRGYWFDYPTVLCSNGRWSVCVEGGLRDDLGTGQHFRSLQDIFNVGAREQRGEHRRYEEHIARTLGRLHGQGHRFGALIVEPVVLGAGGMRLVDPLFQRALVNVVRRCPHLLGSPPARGGHDWSGLPVIFDEVFAGLYRLGRASASSFLGAQPDISVHAKLLTGGLVPLCATLASEPIFRAFGGPDKTDALLHGHSYTAHPVGCQVALESLREMRAMERRGAWDWAMAQGWVDAEEPDGGAGVWSVWPRGFVERLSRRTDRVLGTWALGTVLAIHLGGGSGSATGYASNAALGLREALARGGGEPGARDAWNVHSRMLGNVLYLMAGQTTEESCVRQVADLVEQSLSS